MNTKTLLTVWLLFCFTGIAYGQLTPEKLKEAVQQEDCGAIAETLDTTMLLTEEMKFYGAVCFYRNGDPGRAMRVFQEVTQMHGPFQNFARFWEAKLYAVSGKDSLAMVSLQSIPTGALNTRMLSQPEFEDMSQNNQAFIRLKRSIEPGFDLWTGALSIIACIGLCTSLLLIFGRSRFSAGEKWLGVVVLSFTLILVSYITIWTKYATAFPYLQNIWQFLTLLVGPSLYFYLKATFKEDRTAKEVLLHYAIPCVSLLLTLPAILRNFGIETSMSSDFWRIGTSSTLLTGQLLYYAVRITSITNNEWQVDTNIKTWARTVSRGMWLYTLAFLSYFVLVSCSFFNPQWDYAISLVMALGILGITYMGLIQKRVFSSEPIAAFLPTPKYQSSSLTPNASASIRVKLEQLLKEEQVFKENELRLDDLAAYLDITRHQLSQVINEHYGVNFFELINRYRVEYVKHILVNPDYHKHTIIQVAYEAGFNNKASFNRYFKQETGLTPSEYRIRESGAMSTNGML